MGFDNRHIFLGQINEKTLSDFRQFDYKKTSVDERLQYVENILENSKDESGLNFFENYICSHYKEKLNSTDELSENNNVFKTLENMANYILGSDEVREDRKKSETNYKFYIDESEFRIRTQKEQLFENVANNNDMSSENVIHFLLTSKNENHKTVSSIGVTAKDIDDGTYCGQVLKDYNTLLKHIDKQLKAPEEKYKGKRYLLTKAKKDLVSDMILAKIQLKGIIKSKHVLKDSTEINWDCLDWKNHNHVKELIHVQTGFHPENELSFHMLDLEILVKQMIEDNKFTPSEKKIYKMIRLGLKNNEIADILKVRRTYISNTISVIVKKISNYAIQKKYNL